jgi:hypothetical protein
MLSRTHTVNLFVIILCVRDGISFSSTKQGQKLIHLLNVKFRALVIVLTNT